MDRLCNNTQDKSSHHQGLDNSYDTRVNRHLVERELLIFQLALVQHA